MKYSVSVAMGNPSVRRCHSLGMSSCALPSLLVLLLSLSFAAGQVWPQCGSLGGPSTTWNNGNGSWGVAGNWTSGTPSASTNACILNGTSTVTLDTNGNALGLQLSSGNILVIPGGSLSLLGASSNDGTISVSNYPTAINRGNLINSGTFLNASGGAIADSGIVTNSGTFTNAGAFYVVGGALLTSGTFTNTADPHAQFVIANGGMINSGAFYNYGTVLNRDGVENTSGASFINYGTLNSQFPSVINNSGTFLNTSGGTINTNDMVFNNYGTLSNAGTLNNTSGSIVSTLNNSGTLLNTFGGTFFNDSVSTLTNAGIVINSGTINNSGIMYNSGIFINSGAVAISSSGLFTTNTNYTQTAGSTLVNGNLSATGSAIVNIRGGTLGGTGTINGNVLMGATIMPGAPGTPGTLTIFGNYEQTGTGILTDLMGPLSQSFLNVSGNAKLDSGSFLNIVLLNGFNPLGKTFSIMDYRALTGQFSNGSSFWDDGFLWDISYGQNQIDVTAVQAPEPSSLLLIFIGLVALAFYAHRKMDKKQRLA